MEMKRVKLVFRGQLQAAMKLKSTMVTVNMISHPTVDDFAKHLHQQFALSCICQSIDIMAGDKYLNPMQSTYYFEDNELLTVCIKDARVMGVLDSSKKKKKKNENQRVEENDSFPSVLVTVDVDFESAILKQHLKEERLTVDILQCPRITDLEKLLMEQLRILHICPQAQDLILKVGSFALCKEETTYVLRNGDCVTVCIKKKKDQRRKKRKRNSLQEDASVRFGGNVNTALEIGGPSTNSATAI